MKCLNCEIPMLKFNCSSGGVYYRCPQCCSIAESTVTDYSELSACQEPAKKVRNNLCQIGLKN